MSSEQLEQITTDELMKEIQRRIDCAKKPEKRIILIGMRYSSSFHSFISLVLLFVLLPPIGVAILSFPTSTTSSSSSSDRYMVLVQSHG